MKTTVSVIIPVFNTGEDKLKRCFEAAEKSIRIQEKGSEVLLVDDGSNETTAAFLDRYTAEHPGFSCIHRQNGGASAARNTGIRNAKCEYLCFADADDCLVLPDFRELLKEAPEADLVITDLDVVDETGRTVHWKALQQTGGKVLKKDILKKICTDGKLNGPVCKLIKRSFLSDHEIFFPEDMILGEDLCFFLDLLTGEPAVFYSEQVTYYYYKEASTGNKRMVDHQYQVFSDYLRMHEKADGMIRSSSLSEGEISVLCSQNTERFIKQVFNTAAELVQLKKLDRENLERFSTYIRLYHKASPDVCCSRKARIMTHILERQNLLAVRFYAAARSVYLKMR